MATDDVLRKSRGLGMLLASMGSNKDKGSATNEVVPTVTNVAPEGNEGFDLESSGFSGWDDISSNPRDFGTAGDSKVTTGQSSNKQVTNVAPGGNEGCDPESSGFSGFNDISSNPRDDGTAGDSKVTTGQSSNKQGKSGNTSAGAQKQRSERGKSTKEFEDEDVYGPRSMNRWADIKEYDDDHDGQWFEEENARLAKVYGGNFIYVKYLDSQPGRIGYFCQLCSAEMNAKKSLELHCGGMKHLKRKDQWEKGEQYQADHGEHDGGRPERGNRQPNRWKDPYRSPSHTWSDRGHPRRDSFGGHRPYRGPPSPEYRNDRDHFGRRDDYSRYSDNYYDDYYRKEPLPYRPPYDRDPCDGRSPPSIRHDYDHHPGPTRRDTGDRYQRERFNPYGRREAPPPPVISGPPKPDPGRVPRPPMINDMDIATSELFDGIADGSCSELLKKLSVCRVKNMEDAALATNVANFLVISLREYYSKMGPPTIEHILDEVILKINVMKDLQKY